MFEKRKIVVIENEKRGKKFDDVAIETALKIFINGKEFLTVLCSPENLDCLARGILFTSGIHRISSFSIKKKYCFVETEKPLSFCRRTIFSGCGGTISSTKSKKIKKNSFKISCEKILSLMKEFQSLAKVYKLTGGTHCAGISDGERILIFHEDIGRHNAVDKVIGECVLKGISISEKIMFLSGRISSEIVFKSASAGIPIVVSKSAPTTYGIKIANLYGITLVGFVRGKRMNVYTNNWRIM